MNPSDTYMLEAEKRERVGSRHAKRLRDAGRLPAIVYGHGQVPVPIHIDAKQTVKHITEGEKVFNITMQGESNSQTVLLKDLQFDYLGSNIVHADFTLVDLDERVEVHLPVHLKGTPVGLQTEGAMVLHPTTELTVECRVGDILEYVEVKIDHLEAGDSLHASEITLSERFELLSDPEDVVASVVVKQEEELEGEETEALGEDIEEPEVISERGDEDEGAEGEESSEKE